MLSGFRCQYLTHLGAAAPVFGLRSGRECSLSTADVEVVLGALLLNFQFVLSLFVAEKAETAVSNFSAPTLRSLTAV